jgi:hypothetical protein
VVQVVSELRQELAQTRQRMQLENEAQQEQVEAPESLNRALIEP